MKRKTYNPFLLFLIFLLVILLLVVSSKCIYLNNENEQLKAKLNNLKEEFTVMMQQSDSQHTSASETPPSPTPSNILLDTLKDSGAGTIISKDCLDFNNLSVYFTSEKIDDTLKTRIYGKSYTENEQISLEKLRYLKVLHYNFDHNIQVGECIVNEEIAEDCMEIFTELFKAEYEIYSMYLIDDFWNGDGSSTDTASMNANNSSAFCYRVIAGTTKLSNHALGYAIDINPFQNPYITYRDGMPVYYHDSAKDYADRSIVKEHMITHEDLCYRLFTKHGFTWGGDWKNSKDYQHFEKTN